MERRKVILLRLSAALMLLTGSVHVGLAIGSRTFGWNAIAGGASLVAAVLTVVASRRTAFSEPT